MKFPTNPNSIKTRFAVNFLQSMKKLNKNKPPYKRYHFIKAAARASMASAVGPRRAWSRAVLRKIKNRRRFITRRKRILKRNPREEYSGRGQEDDLRGLVPGGEGMGFIKLLSETEHYIKCLRAQVQVMTNILDHYSTT